jgi:hypothetical protein
MLQCISSTLASPRLGARLIGATKCKSSFHQLLVRHFREFAEESVHTQLEKLLQSLEDEEYTIPCRLTLSPHAPSPRFTRFNHHFRENHHIPRFFIGYSLFYPGFHPVPFTFHFYHHYIASKTNNTLIHTLIDPLKRKQQKQQNTHRLVPTQPSRIIFRF